MQRTDRLFHLIQILRAADAPLTAANIAAQLEVSPRTVYRDVVTLQSMRVPIEGEVGIGYVMQAGYDLPPLNFSQEELEAIVVGLSLLSRTGDRGLQSAAETVLSKIDLHKTASDKLKVSDWGIINVDETLLRHLRQAINASEKLEILYKDPESALTQRTILPLTVTYYVKVAVLGAWCELRHSFRHFRIDRIMRCEPTGQSFAERANKLREELIIASN